jgi:hypothetical protein
VLKISDRWGTRIRLGHGVIDVSTDNSVRIAVRQNVYRAAVVTIGFGCPSWNEPLVAIENDKVIWAKLPEDTPDR